MDTQSSKSPCAKVLWAREVKAVCPHCNLNQNVFLGDPRVFGEEPVIRCEQCADQFGVQVGSYVDPELITESLKPISTDPLAFQVGKYLDLPLSPEMHEENNGWWTMNNSQLNAARFEGVSKRKPKPPFWAGSQPEYLTPSLN
ncbi:hypothetical protein QTV49_004639 [Vibrio vulnificus]|nr:hypothetical protein [Vibrio vulnificus]